MQSSPKGKARVKDTASSSGSPVFVSRRDTICLKRKLSLHPCLVHTCISLCFTGFKLVFFFFCILLYIILCLSVYLSPCLILPPLLLHPFLVHALIPLSQFPYLCTPPPPPGKAVLWISHHTKGTKTKHTNQPQLTLGYSKEQESMVLVLAFGRRKQEPFRPNNEKSHKERMYFVFLHFGT